METQHDWRERRRPTIWQGPWGGPPARPITVNQAFLTPALITGRCLLMGWSVFSAATTVTTITIVDGQDNNGEPAGGFEIPASGSVTQWFGPNGLLLVRGLFIQGIGLNIHGAFYVVPDLPKWWGESYLDSPVPEAGSWPRDHSQSASSMAPSPSSSPPR